MTFSFAAFVFIVGIAAMLSFPLGAIVERRRLPLMAPTLAFTAAIAIVTVLASTLIGYTMRSTPMTLGLITLGNAAISVALFHLGAAWLAMERSQRERQEHALKLR